MKRRIAIPIWFVLAMLGSVAALSALVVSIATKSEPEPRTRQRLS